MTPPFTCPNRAFTDLPPDLQLAVISSTDDLLGEKKIAWDALRSSCRALRELVGSCINKAVISPHSPTLAFYPKGCIVKHLTMWPTCHESRYAIESEAVVLSTLAQCMAHGGSMLSTVEHFSVYVRARICSLAMVKNKVSKALVESLERACPHLDRCTIYCSPPSLNFFASLPSLVNLRHLRISDVPEGAMDLLCGLKGIESLQLPCYSLSQGEAQLLAGMPCLKEVTVGGICLTSALDMQRSSWHTLELYEIPDLQSIPFLPRLSGGLLFPEDEVYFYWELGTVLGSDAVKLATKSTAVSEFLAARSVYHHRTSLILSWEEGLPDAIREELTLEVLSALAPWGIYIDYLRLEGWTVDASVIQAINTHLPSCQTLFFLKCDVTSQAWAEMRWLLPSCTGLIFERTAVTIADLAAFVYTVQRGVKVTFFYVFNDEETDGIDETVDAIPAMLPALEAYRLRAGIPPCSILVEILD